MDSSGRHPQWSRSGDRPVRLFNGGWTLAQGFGFDVLQDGQRFLMIQQALEAIPTRIDEVLNWFTTLKERVK